MIIVAVWLLTFTLFFIVFVNKILSFMYLGKQALCLLKVVVKGSSHRGCPGSSLLLTSVSKRCLHSLHTLFKRGAVEALDAGQLDSSPTPPGDSTLGPRLRRPCLQPDSVPAGKIRLVYFPYAFLLQVGIQKESCAASSRGENCVIKAEKAKKNQQKKTALKANCQDTLKDDFVFFTVWGIQLFTGHPAAN